MNTHVNFEIAKLLKEKGFDLLERPMFYHDKSIQKGCYMYDNDGKLDLISMPRVALDKGFVDCPTIAEVVMWLYEKHGVWIGVELTDNTTDFYFQQTIWTSKDRDWNDTDMVDQAKSICKWKEWRYNSPTEAYSLAIGYTLKNLI